MTKKLDPFEGIEFPSNEQMRKELQSAKISQSKKGKISNHKGKTRPWAGKSRLNKSVNQHSAETKHKISSTKINKSLEEKALTNNKISKSKKGQASWNKGIAMSDNAKQKQSLAKKGKPGKSIKSVQTELGIFQSVKEAIAFHKAHGILNAEKKLMYALKNRLTGYKYL